MPFHNAVHRRLRPLLTPGSQIETRSLDYWQTTRGELPRDLRLLDQVTREERAAIRAAGGRLIPASTPAPAPNE